MPEIGFSSILYVKIAGRKLRAPEDKQLVGGWVDFGAGVPGAFQLTFRDQKRKLLGDLNAKIGERVVIAPVTDGDGAQNPLITAEITALETDYDASGTFTVIRGYDKGHRMFRHRRVKAYFNKSASDIAKELARKSNVPLGKVESSGAKYEFISQPNVTDWEFVQRLADEAEMVMYIDSDGKLQFVKRKPAASAPAVSTPSDKSPFVLAGGVEILRCRSAVTSADQVAEVEVRGWDVKGKRAEVSTAPALKNDGFQIGTTPAEVTSRFGTARRVATDQPYDSKAETDKAAKSLSDDVTSSFAEVDVMARGNPELRPGIPVTLADVGEPFEGKYTVTGARHTFGDQEHYLTHLTVTGRQWRSLYGLTSGGGAGGGNTSLIPSVANALVTNIKDPLKQGRVKLKFPWLDDTYTTDWVRTVQFGGVKGGGIIGPDVNDEVLVAFDRGALDHPFVIGGLYNGEDKPGPVAEPVYDATRGKVTRRTLADRSNNRLDLLDQSTGKKRGVRLATGNDRLTINLDRTKTEIVVDSSGKVTIKGSTSVSVKAGTNLSLTAGGTMSIKSGGLMSIMSGGPLNIRGTALSLLGTAAVTVNSPMAVTIGSAISIGLNAPLVTSKMKPILTVGGV
ncbi:VgrG-related protein [Streptomyces sp. NPDC059096]|uniref:VgrG-related protein n=1 Tax=unclassified Streptomyces TaxID=2593676 RepID=UPI00367C6E4C